MKLSGVASWPDRFCNSMKANQYVYCMYNMMWLALALRSWLKWCIWMPPGDVIASYI